MGKRGVTRRTFLKSTGAAALAGLAGASKVGCKPEAPNNSQNQAAQPTPLPSGRLAEILLAPDAVFRPAASGCTVHWVPNGEVEVRVLAGLQQDRLALYRELTSAEPTQVDLRGFPPDSSLYYQCLFRRRGTAEWSHCPVRRVHTTRPPGSSFRVALIADSHLGRLHRYESAMQNLQQANSMVLADRPDFTIFLGDEVCTKATVGVRPSAASPLTPGLALEKWRLWRAGFDPLLAEIPSYLVLGNHDGEAGYHQVWGETPEYIQRWSTVARKRYFLNPLPDTYPEGGESEGWSGDPASPATGGADEGNCSPLQNYFAWSWGDALFVVLDVHRYTSIGGAPPAVPEEWTLGQAQRRWFERVLTSSQARWKVVMAHHLAGGCGLPLERGKTVVAYGRGGARYARVGEQERITDIMKRAGAQFFIYGHDHVFAHQQAEGIHFVCGGRPTKLCSSWWTTPGWKEAYGLASARKPHDFYAAIGYSRLDISPDKVVVEYVRSGTDRRKAENVAQGEGEVVYRFSIS